MTATTIVATSTETATAAPAKAFDLVIAQLAEDLAEAEEAVARYRMLAVAGIEHIRELTLEIERLRALLQHARDELRVLFTAERELKAARQRTERTT